MDTSIMRIIVVVFSVMSIFYAGCDSDNPSGLICAEGTRMENGQCVPDYEKVICGDGSHEENGECVPDYEKITCGEGSHEEDGECIPNYAPVICGPDTVLEDGACILEEPKITCGEGTVPRGETCVPLADQWVHLPFPESKAYIITQGYHGYFTHNLENNSPYAIDFSVDEGQEIAAAKDGVVFYVKEDSNEGCAEESCADDANVIGIDHGDGTMAVYVHLQQNGADVEYGDTVCAGQIIGRTGNTGYSTGPHLHFHIQDLYGQTMPVKFIELEDQSQGWPISGMTPISDNDEPRSCEDEKDFSSCLEDTFIFMGVRLLSDIPCVIAERDIDYVLSGVSLLGEGKVIVYLYSYSNGDWYNARCIDVDPSGHFDTTFQWPSSLHGSRSYLMIAVCDDDCNSFQGWEYSIPIYLLP